MLVDFFSFLFCFIFFKIVDVMSIIACNQVVPLSTNLLGVYMSDCCLMPNDNFSAISWQEEVTFNDDDVH